MRQIVLDTETTGLDPLQGHKIIEIGCVELDNRRFTDRKFHCYINPDREIDQGAIEVHGITSQFLHDKPRFHQIAQEFLDFIGNAELVIHNAPFDVGFLNHELSLLRIPEKGVDTHCSILDTLVMARGKHPGQRNNLDALCKRYYIDNTQRELHGALLDAEILADVYLAMTSGQSSLLLKDEDGEEGNTPREIQRVDSNRPALAVLQADTEELEAHQQRLKEIDESSEGNCLWLSSEV